MPDIGTVVETAKAVGTVPVTIASNNAFTWTSFFTGGSFLALVALVIRQIGPWRKQRDETELELSKRLTLRVDKLESQLERERAKHEAERALDRHKINNLRQCLDAVLLVLEKAPDKTVEVVAEIRAMRERQMRDEMAEAAAIRAAEIAAAAKSKGKDDDQPAEQPAS